MLRPIVCRLRRMRLQTLEQAGLKSNDAAPFLLAVEYCWTRNSLSITSSFLYVPDFSSYRNARNLAWPICSKGVLLCISQGLWCLPWNLLTKGSTHASQKLLDAGGMRHAPEGQTLGDVPPLRL